MQTFRTRILVISTLMGLAACSTSVSPDMMVMNTDEGGFSGKAGSAWTPAEIQDFARTSGCGGTAPETLDIVADGTNYTFSGTC